MFIDSHCHLDFPIFEQSRLQLLQNCNRDGITSFIIPSVNESNWQSVKDVCQLHASCHPAFGIHPCFLTDFEFEMLERLKQMLQLKQTIAIGEIGLDKTAANMNLQEQVFQAQCELGIELQLPLLIHSRQSHDKIYSVLKSYQGRLTGIIHGFSGSYQQAMSFYQLGFKIGVGGVITYPRATKTINAISRLPIDAFVLETDSPDMPIYQQTTKMNTPLNIPSIAQALAHARSEPIHELIEQTTKNTLALFPKLKQ